MKDGVSSYRLPEFERASRGDLEPSASTESKIETGFVPFTRNLTSATAAAWHEEAQALLNEAKRKASGIEQEAYRQGFSQGERAGTQLAQEKLTPLLEGFVRVMSELEALRERIYSEAERELVELACAVAEKVMQLEVGVNREVVLKGVQAALRGLVDREEVRVRVNPADLAFLRQYKGDLMKSVDGLRRVAIEEDPSVGRGGYIVEIPGGNLDGRLEEQVARIREEFLAQCPPIGQEPACGELATE